MQTHRRHSSDAWLSISLRQQRLQGYVPRSLTHADSSYTTAAAAAAAAGAATVPGSKNEKVQYMKCGQPGGLAEHMHRLEVDVVNNNIAEDSQLVRLQNP
jgi:hypothetical protein